MSHQITFHPSGWGKARCAPDPEFPDGVWLDAADESKPSCLIELPYPAPECGMWFVECDQCEIGAVAITATGRPDDPRSVRINCNNPKSGLAAQRNLTSSPEAVRS